MHIRSSISLVRPTVLADKMTDRICRKAKKDKMLRLKILPMVDKKMLALE